MYNYKAYKYWKQRKKNKKILDLDRGSGYYIASNCLKIGMTCNQVMESGQIGIFELFDFKTYYDPSDMIKFTYWTFVGYQDVKPIRECSFEEFLNLYASKK